ncbi:MAG: 2-oxoacid:acceptor oxidoreductase family protein [Thermoleophilia bacterium]|nr:2-oxoacid:acceptor oxidoreductase family protein [Thermoleophilia bacterium]
MSEIGPSGFSQPAIGTGPAPARAGLLAERDFLEVRFGGTGEQGVILMGVILAMAATLDHRYVAQTQTYGLGEREGYGHSDVIISDYPIDYPEIEGADVLVALCQDAADGYVDLLRPSGILIYDPDDVAVPLRFRGTTFGVSFNRLYSEMTGRPETASEVLALGAVAAITGVVSQVSLRKAMLSTVGAGVKGVNEKALARGLDLDPAEWRKDGTCS